MLFVKRGKARSKGQQFPNLALQSTGKRYTKVSDAKGVKPQLQSGAIPVVDSINEDTARRENLRKHTEMLVHLIKKQVFLLQRDMLQVIKQTLGLEMLGVVRHLSLLLVI